MTALQGVSGVGRIVVAAGARPIVLVEMREDELARRGITVADVMDALGRSTHGNVQLPAGRVEWIDQPALPDDGLRWLRMAAVGQEGRPPPLADVARVSRAHVEVRAEPPVGGILLAVYAGPGVSRDRLLVALEARAAELTAHAGQLERGGAPPGVRVKLVP